MKTLARAFSDPLRAAVALAVIGLAVFVAVGVYQAGFMTPQFPIEPTTQLDEGVAEGRRINGRSWSFDYNTVRMTPDGTIADIDGVHDGIIFRKGKPFLKVTAKHITINTQTNDFTATGPIHMVQIDTKHHRTFSTDAAYWTAASQMLTLPHPSIVTSDGAKLSIGKVTMDFRTGDTKIGAMHGAVNP